MAATWFSPSRIWFPLPAGGAEEEEIGRARADAAVELTLACVGKCCSDEGFCCALLTGRLQDFSWIHDDAAAYVISRISKFDLPPLTFQERNAFNKAAVTFSPLLKRQIQLVKMLRGTFKNEILARFPSGEATKSTMWHLINYSILAGRPLGHALC